MGLVALTTRPHGSPYSGFPARRGCKLTRMLTCGPADVRPAAIRILACQDGVHQFRPTGDVGHGLQVDHIACGPATATKTPRRRDRLGPAWPGWPAAATTCPTWLLHHRYALPVFLPSLGLRRGRHHPAWGCVLSRSQGPSNQSPAFAYKPEQGMLAGPRVTVPTAPCDAIEPPYTQVSKTDQMEGR